MTQEGAFWGLIDEKNIQGSIAYPTFSVRIFAMKSNKVNLLLNGEIIEKFQQSTITNQGQGIEW
jgi:hypothetical protein